MKKKVNEANPALKFARKDQVLLNKLRIGHSKIKRQLLLSNENPNTCDSFKIKITITHIFTEYTIYTNERKKFNLEDSFEKLLRYPYQCKKYVNL